MKRISMLFFVLFTICLLAAGGTAHAGSIPPETMIPMGAIARVTDDGLLFLCDELTDVITEDLIDSLLTAQNPIFDEEIDLWGFTIASAEVNVEEVTLNEPIYLHLNAEPDHLKTLLIVTNLRIYVEAHGEIMEIDWSSHGEIYADQVVINVDAYIDVVGGKFHVTLPYGSTVDLNGFGFDINNFPGELEDWFEDDVRDLLEDTFEDQIDQTLPEELNALFNELEFYDEIYESLWYQAEAYEVAINSTGATLMLKGMVFTDHHDECVPPPTGSYYTVNRCPTYGETVPGTGEKYELVVSISDDILNQTLMATYDAGVMCVDIEDEEILNTSFWRYFLPELYDIAPDSPIIVRLLPTHAPVVKFSVQGELMGILMPNMVVEFHVYIDDILQRAFSIELDARAIGGVRLLEGQNTLKFYLRDIEVDSTILTEDLCDIRDPALQKYLPFLMELILPRLVRTIEEFPIPYFEGFSIMVKAIVADGTHKDFLSIYGDFMAAAP